MSGGRGGRSCNGYIDFIGFGVGQQAPRLVLGCKSKSPHLLYKKQNPISGTISRSKVNVSQVSPSHA